MSARRTAPADAGCLALLLKWVVAAAAIYLTAWVLPGVSVEDFLRAMAVALVLGLLNTLVRPFLVVLTLPITVLTLGLFLLVINALMILLAGWLLAGFAVDGFGWALLAAILISLLNLLFDAFVEGVRQSL